MKRFRGGLVFEAQTCVSRNCRLENNEEEEAGRTVGKGAHVAILDNGPEVVEDELPAWQCVNWQDFFFFSIALESRVQ